MGLNGKGRRRKRMEGMEENEGGGRKEWERMKEKKDGRDERGRRRRRMEGM